MLSEHHCRFQLGRHFILFLLREADEKVCLIVSHFASREYIIVPSWTMLTHARAPEDRCLQITSTDRHVGLTEVHLRHSRRRRRKAITVRRSDFSRSSSFHVRVFCHLQLPPGYSSEIDWLKGIFGFSYESYYVIQCNAKQV